MKKEALTKFYSAYKLIIFPAIVVLSCVILIIFIIYPQTTKFISSSGVEQDMVKRSAFLDEKAETLEGYDESDLETKLNYALSAFPSEKDFATVVGILQNIIAQSGFTLVTMTLGGTAGKSGEAQSYVLRLDLVGPIISLKDLVTNIESSPRIMRLNSLETTVGSDPNLVSVLFSVDVLYSAVPSTFGNVDSTLPELNEKDNELLATLVKSAPPPALEVPTQLGPRGKANPFE